MNQKYIIFWIPFAFLPLPKLFLLEGLFHSEMTKRSWRENCAAFTSQLLFFWKNSDHLSSWTTVHTCLRVEYIIKSAVHCLLSFLKSADPVHSVLGNLLGLPSLPTTLSHHPQTLQPERGASLSTAKLGICWEQMGFSEAPPVRGKINKWGKKQKSRR